MILFIPNPIVNQGQDQKRPKQPKRPERPKRPKRPKRPNRPKRPAPATTRKWCMKIIHYLTSTKL